jgi:hypothetical protein
MLKVSPFLFGMQRTKKLKERNRDIGRKIFGTGICFGIKLTVTHAASVEFTLSARNLMWLIRATGCRISGLFFFPVKSCYKLLYSLCSITEFDEDFAKATERLWTTTVPTKISFF